MATNLFSTYSTGENRVTASVLAVLGSLSLDRIQRLLGALLEESEFELVRLENQPSRGAPGVPDAAITSSCRVLVETKVRPRSVDRDQLRRHLSRLDGAGEATRRLLVLTPDAERPAAIEEIDDERVAWASFATLDQAVDDLVGDPREVVSEREAFLLRELQAMFAAENLIASEKDVVVVPARHAWPKYRRWEAYVCQADRSFRAVQYVAFYSQGRIQTLVPRILESHDHVVFEHGLHEDRLGDVVHRMLEDSSEPRRPGDIQKVLLLSGPDDPATLELAAPIENDLVSKSGRVTAFTQNQRYVASARLRVAKRTSELV